jgi:predicted DCC family thiol-disulfide oxidoreductase YuxK
LSSLAGGKPAQHGIRSLMDDPRVKTTMYYDGGCPVCMRGVAHWRRLDWARRIAWVDLMEYPDALESDGVSFAEAMDVLHVRRRDGSLAVGVPGFAALWSELPGYRWLARLLSPPWMMALADRLYRVTHRDRYRRRCRDGACAVPGSGGGEGR